MGFPKPLAVTALALFCVAYSLAAARTVTVFAAASLKESFEEIARVYERTHPGCRVLMSFAGSQQLATQLALGARADVFASADQAQMNKVVAAHRIGRGQVRTLALNKLAVAVSNASSTKVSSLNKLGERGVRLVLAGPRVPAGAYAQQSLASMAREFGSAWLLKVKSNVMSNELDVRTILAKVQLGEADAGIVYVTDLRAAKGNVAGLTIPDRFNVTAKYQVAPIVGSSDGAEFVKLIVGQTGRRALSQRGFIVPNP